MTNDDPNLERALDGLIAAADYAEEIDEHELSSRIGRCYQDIGAAAPDEHWDNASDAPTCIVCSAQAPVHYFGSFKVPDKDSEGEYQDTSEEIDGLKVAKWTGDYTEIEYWECDTCYRSDDGSTDSNQEMGGFAEENIEQSMKQAREDLNDSLLDRARIDLDTPISLQDTSDGSADDSLSELLDWLCWSWATTGERFYPPDETAKECVESIDSDDGSGERAWEEGYHSYAYNEAVDRFNDLKSAGYDPVRRAERHIEEARKDDLDLPDIDWEWWEAARTEGE